MSAQGISSVPIRPLPPGADRSAIPCRNCDHNFAEHEFMYSFGGRDRYKCQKCDCGEQYKLIVARADGNIAGDPKTMRETAKKVAQAIDLENERAKRR